MLIFGEDQLFLVLQYIINHDFREASNLHYPFRHFPPTCFTIRGKKLSRNTKLNHNIYYKIQDLEKNSYVVQNFIDRCRKNFFYVKFLDEINI